MSNRCDFCGTALNDGEIECPLCGHIVGSRILSDVHMKVKAEKVNKILPAKTKKRYEPLSRNAKPGVLAAVFPAANCLLAIVLIVITCTYTGKVNSGMASMESQYLRLYNMYETLSGDLSQLNSKTDAVNSTLSEQETSKNITITKEPTSAATYLGRGGVDDNIQNAAIFRVNAEGQDLNLVWQIFDEKSNSWVDIVFDEGSNNETYGLHVYTDSYKGFSELSAHGLTSAGFASYRCKITDRFGAKYTNTVTISEKEA